MRIILATIIGVGIAARIYEPSKPGHDVASFAAGAVLWVVVMNVVFLFLSIAFFEQRR